MPLCNRVDKRELKKRLQEIAEKYVTISFYQYHQIENPTEFRNSIYQRWNALGVMGRVYVAHEGINAQIAVPEKNLDLFNADLDTISFLKGIRRNYAVDDNGKSFFKLKIVVKDKIVADGLDDKTFNPSDTGVHLDAKEFNTLVENPDTILVDMRNHYEHEIGHFKGAILPDVDTFREELPVVAEILKGKEDKNLVMYCTGGIRCEKASAWFKHIGFKNVHQLNGGIIEYARQVKNQGLENKFIGKNFVFDERLGERISDDVISHCHQCGTPCDNHTNCVNEGCHLLFIQCDDCKQQYENCCTEACQKTIHLPEEEKKSTRKGINRGRQVYKKGRSEQLLFGKKEKIAPLNG